MALLLVVGGILLVSSAYATVVVRMDVAWGITEGNIDVLLRDDLPWDTFTADANHSAANPVTNFLSYVNSGSYSDTFFHRRYTSGSISIIQAGGYTWDTTQQAAHQITTTLPIYYQAKMANSRGTIAMARTTDPNSATSGWFINVTDNTAAWADQPSCDTTQTINTGCGYTAFGTVLNGMDLVDQINALPILNCSGDFASLPLYNYVGCAPQTQNLAVVKSISVINTVAAAQGTSGSYTIVSSVSPVTVSAFDVVASQPPPPLLSDINYSNFVATQFSEGYFNLQLANVPAGASETVTMTLPPGSLPNTFYRYGPTPDNPAAHWYNFAWDGQTGAITTLGGNVIKLVFVDGQRGDDDLTQNGSIGVSVAAPGANPSVGSSVSAIGTSGNPTVISFMPPITASSFTAVTGTLPPPATTDINYNNFLHTQFSEGNFNLQLANVPAGVSETVAMTLPQGWVPNTFYRYGPTPDNPAAHWYNFMWDGQTGAVMTLGSNVVQLVFVDGQRGDDDLTQNGNIDVSAIAPGVDLLIGASASAIGISQNYSTLSLQSGADVLTKFESAASPPSLGAPLGVTFGEGFFGIELKTAKGGSAVLLTLPMDQHPNTYYKYGPTPDNHSNHWYEFMWDGTTGAVIGDGIHSPKNTIALVFVAGARGDDNFMNNTNTNTGLITDVGAPGVKPVSSGGGGGGAIDDWSLFVLMGLRGWLSGQRRRRGLLRFRG
jgi:cyclophilin family peptidyl-prolyl cis-trans isomerase